MWAAAEDAPVKESYPVTVNAEEADVTWDSTTCAGVVGLMANNVADRTLVKKGGGRLIIACDLKGLGYKGEIRVKEGFLRLFHDGACGTTDAGVVVESGATLEGDSTYKSGGLKYQDENLTFGGFGVNGVEGAVKMIGNGTWNFFYNGKKTMTEDSLWNGTGRLDVRSGTFDMGGHTFYATNTVAFVGAQVVNPGRIVLGKGSPSMEASMDFAGDASNEFVFDGAEKFNMVSTTKEPQWTMVLSNTVVVTPRPEFPSSRTNMANAVTVNRWAGPVYIGEGASLTVQGNWVDPTKMWGEDCCHHLINFNGKISGPGSVKVGQYYGYLRLKNYDNDFTGGLTVENDCLLEAAGIGSLGVGPISIAQRGRIDFLYNGMAPFTMTDAEMARIFAFKRKLHPAGSYLTPESRYSISGLGGYRYTSALSDGQEIRHDETNTLTLAGLITGSPTIVNTAGELVFAGQGANELGNLRVSGGTVRFTSGAKCFFDMNTWMVNGVYPACPRLVVEDGAIVGSFNDPASKTVLPRNYLGGGCSNPQNLRGILEILDGATVTNQLSVGGGYRYNLFTTNAMGAVYLRGGRLVQYADNSRDEMSVGYGANGYFEQTGGMFDASQKSEWILVGAKLSGNYEPGHGTMHIKGGEFVHRSVGFVINSGGGYGHVRVSDGVVSNSSLAVGKSIWTGKSGGVGALTVDGGHFYVTGDAQMGGISNSVSIININGGVFEPNSIYVTTNQSQQIGSNSGQPCDYLNANNPTYVNLNGGVFKPIYPWEDAADFFHPRITRYTVFAGGAVLDTGKTYRRRLAVSLRPPTGKGVQAVDFSCAVPWRYLGSPYVRIVDPTGAGYGATAFADYDSVNGVVTGVTVTSPGCDYGEGTYAEIAMGGYTNIVHAAVTLAANDTTGGFTKKGSTRLLVQATNYWQGVTRVEEGELMLKSNTPGLLPDTVGFDVAEDATLNLNGNAAPTGTLAGTGTVQGDFTLAGTLTVDARDLVAGKALSVTGTLTIEPGTRLVVLNASELPAKMVHKAVVTAAHIEGALVLDSSFTDGKWSLAQKDGIIAFGSLRGIVINVR